MEKRKHRGTVGHFDGKRQGCSLRILPTTGEVHRPSGQFPGKACRESQQCRSLLWAQVDPPKTNLVNVKLQNLIH